MKTCLIFPIGFLWKPIEYGCTFSDKTQRPSSSLSCFFWVATILFFLLLPIVSYPQPALVKDINKTPHSAISPGPITTFKGILYFSAESSEHGRELWRSDGTDAGTYLLKDITAGKNSSSPSMFTIVGNTLYFVANEVHKEDYLNYEFEHHYELWKTDGTTQGTVKVGYFPMQSPQTNLYEAYPGLQLVAAKEALYFTVNNAPGGYELWKTHGSTTKKVLDVSGNPYTGVYLLRAAGNNVYFTASNSSANITLWRTDGTTIGTTLVKESSSSYGISSLTAIGDKLFFTFEDGQELWKSNGTPEGTQLVKEIKAGGLFDASGLLYFTVTTNPTTQLWKSDGTTEGTVLVKDGLIGPAIQTAIGTTIYFISSSQLWKSDGTAAGTLMIKSFEHEPSVSIQAKAANNILYIRVYANHTYVLSLWKSDGTPEGTMLLREFNPYENDVFTPFLVTLQESAYFVARETLWKSSGTPDSTLPLYPGGLSENQGSYPSSLLSVNGQVYFIVSDGASGFELWKTGGSEANTVLVKRNGGTGPAQKANLLSSSNTTAYFQVASYNTSNQLVNTQLWKSDGTAASTVLVKTLNTGVIGEARSWNGYLYFFTGKQLWKSNGTPQGTTLVKNINTEFIGLLTIWNNALYFRDENALWKSDGTPQGTIVLKNIDGDGIANFTPGNGTLYFTDYATGLWKTDGTPAGTVPFGPKILGINSMVFYKSALYFSSAENLYKSNGTTAGTTVIKTFVKYGENYVENLTVAGNTLYFTFLSINSDLSIYNELWKSDGTPQGTQVVKLVGARNLKTVNNTLLFEVPGVLSGKSANQLWRSNGTAENTSQVAELSIQFQTTATAGNTIYFSADDGKRGYELWKYDVEACTQAPLTNLIVEGSTVCSGENGKISIKDSQAGVSYQAYFNNGSTAGVVIMGGGDITLMIPKVSLSTGNNQFTIKAGGCTLVTLTGTATITVTSTCATACSGTGNILREYWANVIGNSVSSIPVNTTPSSSSQLTSFETPVNKGDNYAERIRGYLCVPQSGSYTFYIAGDDNCALYLSTDDDPAKKTKIASVPSYTLPRQWNKYAAQQSAAISLQAGKKYYIEALHKEGAAGDHLAVAWQAAATEPITIIPGSYLSPYLPQGEGTISREYWANVAGNQVTDIPLNTAASFTDQITVFETPTNTADNYAQRIRGYVHPQQSGLYRFLLAGDNACELWLSSDDNPANKRQIARVNLYTLPRQWNKYSSQLSGLTYLVAGRKYYIEALHKEGAGGDHLAVGWQLPSTTSIAVLAGTYLSPFLASPTSTARIATAETMESSVSLHPNPFDNKLTLVTSHTGKVFIAVLDNLGSVIMETSTQATGSAIELNLSSLSQGVYLLKLTTKDGASHIRKIVKR